MSIPPKFFVAGRLQYAAAIALLAAAYVLAGRLGFTASTVHPVVSSAWAPSGIALAALLLFGVRLWPGVALGAFAVNMTGGIAPLAAFGIAVGNTLEALTAAWLLTSVAGFRLSLDRPRDVLALVLSAVAAAPVSATIGVAVLTISAGAATFPSGAAWLAWASGDAIGILIVAPVMLTWAAGAPLRPSARDVLEAAMLAVFLIASSVVLFQAPVSYVYAIFPLVIWAALRFGPQGAATASLVVSILAIGYTVQGIGPFTTSTLENNLFRLQTFLGVLTLTALILGAVIAERRAAEAALQRSRKEHRDIVHYASLGVYQTDRNGMILLANPALARILGYEEPEQLVGRNLADQHWSGKEPDLEGDEPEPVGPPGSGLEMQWRRKDGSPIWVDIHSRAVVDAAGEIAYHEGFVSDLTARKQLEDQFRQSQKMEAVGRLAGGVAHDFNNLLTVIGSCTDFVLADPALPADHRSDLTELKKAADRATMLTRQLLAFGRTQILRPSTISLNERLAEVVPLLKRLFETTIEIRLDTAPNLWAVRADPGQIEQVLMNLAINSRDAMPEGGTLTFVTENCVVEAERARPDAEYTVKPGEYVVLTVRDTGVGMGEDIQRRIFEPFFTTKEMGKGTGLGLSTAYGIVRQSGGYFKVRSAPGKGSEFLIYLPRTRATPDTVAPREPRDGRRGSATVLVAEDEPGVRAALQRILAGNGYTVITASDGAQALALFTDQAEAIDLLVTDVVMPGMDGRELARQCRNLRGALKVIYLSGYTRDSLLNQQTFEEGMEFIEKPFTRDKILDRVGQVLAS